MVTTPTTCPALSPADIAIAARHRMEVEGLCGDALVEWFGRLGNVTVHQHGGLWFCADYGQRVAASSADIAIARWCAVVDGGSRHA